MPRPKPEEPLFPFSVRFTRNQLRKIQQMGGGAWLRDMVSKTQASKHGRDPVLHVKTLKERNLHIASSDLQTQVLASKYNLSVQRVRQIKKQYSTSE